MIIAEKTVKLFEAFFPGLSWHYPEHKENIYLTFDDGPTPGVTDYVLSILEKYQAKATFFCLGRNVEAHPELYRQILNQGHATGNHTWSHPDAFKVKARKYYAEIERANVLIGQPLFRPPYGRIFPWHVRRLTKDYSIIMWNILVTDYKKGTDLGKMQHILEQKTRGGSVVVMHDNLRAKEMMFILLPRFLEHFSKKGFTFKAITAHNCSRLPADD